MIDRLLSNRKLKEGIVSGVKKGWGGFIWMIKILLPISFFTSIFAWSGWLERISSLFTPIFHFLGVSPIASLPLLIGMLTGIYGGIASMVVLPLTKEEMTIIAIFLLIAHNLIQEGVVQGKSGINPIKVTIFRLSAAIFTIMWVRLFLDVIPSEVNTAIINTNRVPLISMLKKWGIDSFQLTVKIFFIIMGLMILLETLKSLGWIEKLVNFLSPFLRLLGLDKTGGVIWTAAVIFGLAYSAALIVEEAKSGQISPSELEKLHLSIGINHSMVEDPTLFLAMGLGAFWLWIPRLITAIIAVRLLTLWQKKRNPS